MANSEGMVEGGSAAGPSLRTSTVPEVAVGLDVPPQVEVHPSPPLTAPWMTGPFLQAVQSLPMGAAVVALGPVGQRRILVANAPLAQMLRVPVEDLPGRDFQDFSEPEYAEEELAAVRSLVSGERSIYVRQKRYRRADGCPLWVELRSTVLDAPAGVPAGVSAQQGGAGVVVLATFVDITARHQRQRRWALTTATKSAITSIITRVLAGEPEEEVYQLFVDRVACLFDASNVTLQLIDPRSGPARVVAGIGPADELLRSGQVELPPDIARKLTAAGIQVMAEPILDWAMPFVGPLITARFGPDSGGGLLAVGRPPGAALFTEEDGDLVAALAQQVALALELGRARADQARLAVLEDRERIARDLHDTVIQDLIAIGIQLDMGRARETDPDRRERDNGLIEQLEEAVRHLRGSVFDLRTIPAGPSFEDTFRTVAADARRALGHRPVITISGYLDAVPPALSHAVLAVLREALSNVARHAQASHTWIHLDVGDDEVRLVVDDDGRGLPGSLVPGDGLANIHRRAAGLRGEATIAPRPGGGTHLVWTGVHPPQAAGPRRP